MCIIAALSRTFSHQYRWWLIDARLDGRAGASVTLRVRCARHGREGCECAEHWECEPLDLPVSSHGRVHELIRLPAVAEVVGIGDRSGHQLQPLSIIIRRVGTVERVRRMLWRIWNTARRLSSVERRRMGLSVGKVLSDIPAAYRSVSRFRHSIDYRTWIATVEKEIFDGRAGVEVHMPKSDRGPSLAVVVVIDDVAAEDPSRLYATLTSLRKQMFRGFSCTVVNIARAFACPFNERVGLESAAYRLEWIEKDAVHKWLDDARRRFYDTAPATWIMLLKAGDRLPPHALLIFAKEAARRPTAGIIYSDHDLFLNGERSYPAFKPDWSIQHYLEHDFVGRAALINGGLVAGAGGVMLDDLMHGPYALALRCLSRVTNAAHACPVHLPFVLLHQCSEGSDCSESWAVRAVEQFIQDSGIDARVVPRDHPSLRVVKYSLPAPPPRVSILIPTRDGFNLLRQCIESLIAITDYPDLEILVIDNQSSDSEALRYLSSLDGRRFDRGAVRVLCYPKAFNFSAINNLAAREASGTVLCLLNNDTEIRDSGWLAEMVGQLVQAGVAVVGAKLLFADGTVQHAGDAVGPGGCADHMFSGLPGDAMGYGNLAVVAREVSAVTAACMVTWRDVYLKLGGMDERKLKVAFNDVDYCLRVRQAGYKVVFTPHAVVLHHESATRGLDRTHEANRRTRREADVVRRRWKSQIQVDPFYNPNLNYARPDFTLGVISRAPNPCERMS